MKKLRRYGFRAVRVPMSAPSSEPLPDVFATKGDCIIAFEVKAPNTDRAYFRRDQVKKLFEFLDIFGVYGRRLAILCAKFPYKWVFKVVENPDDYVIGRDDESDVKLDRLAG